jgi:hypothetical protein
MEKAIEMSIFRRLSGKKAKSKPNDLPARNALYFYLIIAASVVLPVMIMISVIHLPVAMNIILLTLVVAIIATGVSFCRRFSAQTEDFVRQMRLLEVDRETRLSILGGLIRVRIGRRNRRDQEPKLIRDESNNPPEA